MQFYIRGLVAVLVASPVGHRGAAEEYSLGPRPQGKWPETRKPSREAAQDDTKSIPQIPLVVFDPVPDEKLT